MIPLRHNRIIKSKVNFSLMYGKNSIIDEYLI